MVHVKEMTDKERVAMYMKCSKKELISMLMENQRMVKIFIERENKPENQHVVSDYPFGFPITVSTTSPRIL